MFGYVTANCTALTQQQLDRYRGCYCGLCRALGRRYGTVQRAFVSYDLAFFIMLRSALDEAEETIQVGRCPTHPLPNQQSWSTSWTDFGADLDILLAWYSADDSVLDGKKLSGSAARRLLNAAFEKAKGRRPKENAWIAI